MSITFGGDSIRSEVTDLLHRIKRDETVDASQEYKHVDLKEEAGRRDTVGRVVAGGPENEKAAKQLAAEAACMSNTPGGGALLVGVENNGTLIGAELDAEWLRHRIYQISNKATDCGRKRDLRSRQTPLGGHDPPCRRARAYQRPHPVEG